MMGDGAHEVTSPRPGRVRAAGRSGSRFRWPGSRLRGPHRLVALLAVAVLTSSALAACGSSNASTGPVTLNYYSFPDNSGAIQQAVTTCSAQSGGKYTISYNKLPNSADGQPHQMVRPLPPRHTPIDILPLSA